MIGTWKLVSGKADAIDLTPSSSNPKDVQLVYEKEVQPGGDTGDEPGDQPSGKPSDNPGNEPSGQPGNKGSKTPGKPDENKPDEPKKDNTKKPEEKKSNKKTPQKKNPSKKSTKKSPAQSSPIRLSKLDKPSKVRSHLSQLRKPLAGLLTMLYVQRACTEITLHLVKTCTETMFLHQKATMLRCLSQK